MRMFDAHCHLQDERLTPRMNVLLDRAADAGVEAVMCCGSSEQDWPHVADLCPSRPRMLRSFGLHPWHVRHRSPRWKDVLSGLLREQASGVGEIGLDHAIEDRDDADQEAVFVAQLALARELARPVSIHCCRAWNRMIELLRAFGKHEPGVVIHSFSGSSEHVVPLAECGVHFSFCGSITQDDDERAWRALQAVPLDRLLIETDAPDQMPLLPADQTRDISEDHSVNEPANLIYVLLKVAELRRMSAMDVAELTWANAQRVFANAMPGRE
jgi:TatD DNase family protein